MRAPNDVTKAISETLALLNGPAWPCERERPPGPAGIGSCLGRETKRDEEASRKRSDGMRMGWHGYDPARMCPACAAAWHVACAYNFALGVRR